MYYGITGRIPYDDEDTPYAIEADSLDEAYDIFTNMIYRDRDMEPPEEDHEEETGEASVFIINAFESDSPIRIVACD